MSTVKSPTQRPLGEMAEDGLQTGSRIVKPPPLPSIPEIQQLTGPRENHDHLRHCFVPADKNGCLGLHLSRTPWDPYPWVSGVVEGSCADTAGVRIGDCVLEANGEDLLGLKVIDIAKRVRGRKASRTTPAGVGLLLWNSGFEKNNLNPQSLSRFANCLQGITGLLECPICLEIIRPPSWQCNHGHLICSGCRSRTTKCPICREVLGRGRCIVADKLFHYLVQTLGREDKHQSTVLGPKSQDTKHNQQPPNGQANISGRLPLVHREHQHRPSQHRPAHPLTHKHAFKLKANIGPNDTPASVLASQVTTPAPIVPVTFHCPSGQPCARMKNQHDILIHLQKAHQTSVVQYYVTAGDTVDVALVDGGNSLACVVLLPTPSFKGNHLFFVAKFRSLEEPSDTLCWLWHLGEELESGQFQVQLHPIATDDRQSGMGVQPWQGRPVPLEWSCREILKSRQYTRIKQDIRRMRVSVRVYDTNDATGT
uniref:RING-type domain-containing protein n=1 Tax=Anopheles culicifacies TaxID=139723 RepID=A0A182LZK1_9DIPT